MLAHQVDVIDIGICTQNIYLPMLGNYTAQFNANSGYILGLSILTLSLLA
jgi:hypothetical protein